ncbi:uncharacterized protein LOC144661153 [Oculina patagonica]
MFPPTKPGYTALTRQPNKEDREALYTELRAYGRFTGLSWILSPEPIKPQRDLPVPTIEELIFSEEFLTLSTADEQLEFIRQKLKVEEEIVQQISKLTIGQRNNPSWHLVRKGRLTASNFGSVIKAKRVTPSLIKRLLGEYDISRVKAVAWGITNEAEAIKAFTSATGLKVNETGVWLDGTGVLGASPDGLVGEDHVFEAKCSYTFRNESIEEALKSSTFCLERKEDGSYSLKRDHVYWHQAQGQMYLAKRNNCYFVVWTNYWFVIIEIKKDPSWEENLTRLREFYFKHIFPKIIEGEL